MHAWHGKPLFSRFRLEGFVSADPELHTKFDDVMVQVSQVSQVESFLGIEIVSTEEKSWMLKVS
jgi:hypothetical protein